VLLVAGFVLIAANLRAGITSVGPLVEEIRESTGMSAAVAGLLTTLPVVVFAAMSPLAAPIARRVGIERALGYGLVALLAGLLLRSAGPVAALLAGTVMLGAGIALGNVLLPSLIKQDFPDRVGAMTGLYATTQVAFGGLASGVSVPLAEGAGLGWTGSLGAWAVLAAVGLLVWWPVAAGSRHVPPDERPAVRLRRSPIAWQLTLYLGGQSLVFFTLITWLPTILRDDGMSAVTAGWMLMLLQLSGAVATVTIPLLGARRRSQSGLVVLSAGLCVLALAGFAGLPAALAPLWVIVVGYGLGACLTLAFTMFVLRAPDPHTAGALAGMAQMFGYVLAATGPIGVGVLHDVTGSWTVPLLVLLAVMAAALAAGVGSGRDREIG
jgi:CP family cyanate transporter-like MFS transporter